MKDLHYPFFQALTSFLIKFNANAFIYSVSVVLWVRLTWFTLILIYVSSFLHFIYIALTSFSLRFGSYALGTSFLLCFLHNTDLVFAENGLLCLQNVFSTPSFHCTISFSHKFDSNAFSTSV